MNPSPNRTHPLALDLKTAAKLIEEVDASITAEAIELAFQPTARVRGDAYAYVGSCLYDVGQPVLAEQVKAMVGGALAGDPEWPEKLQQLAERWSQLSAAADYLIAHRSPAKAATAAKPR